MSKTKKQTDPLKVPSGIDASTYFFPTIPEEVKSATTVFHSYPPDTLEKIIDKVFQYLILNKIKIEEINADQSEFGEELKVGDFNLMMSGTFFIINTAVRNKINITTLRTDLTSMNIPKPFIDVTASRLMKFRSQLEATAIESRIRFPKLNKLRWRIDVTISSGSLSRIMRPNILMQVEIHIIYLFHHYFLIKNIKNTKL
jgi:hypothetical protein